MADYGEFAPLSPYPKEEGIFTIFGYYEIFCNVCGVQISRYHGCMTKHTQWHQRDVLDKLF